MPGRDTGKHNTTTALQWQRGSAQTWKHGKTILLSGEDLYNRCSTLQAGTPQAGQNNARTACNASFDVASASTKKDMQSRGDSRNSQSNVGDRGPQCVLSKVAFKTDWSALGKRSASQLLTISQPRGHGVCDHNEFERWANILTSMPYAAVGMQTIRKQQSSEGRCFGLSLIAVAAGSTIYHTSRGKYRSLGRKIDYWAIAVASAALVRASCQPAKLTTIASLLLTPLQPFAVVAANGAVYEAKLYRRAQLFPELRSVHRRHVATSALGGACFAAEEFWPKAPLIHASWHIMSAAGLMAMLPMLQHIEKHGS